MLTDIYTVVTVYTLPSTPLVYIIPFIYSGVHSSVFVVGMEIPVVKVTIFVQHSAFSSLGLSESPIFILSLLVYLYISVHSTIHWVLNSGVYWLRVYLLSHSSYGLTSRIFNVIYYISTTSAGWQTFNPWFQTQPFIQAAVCHTQSPRVCSRYIYCLFRCWFGLYLLVYSLSCAYTSPARVSKVCDISNSIR